MPAPRESAPLRTPEPGYSCSAGQHRLQLAVLYGLGAFIALFNWITLDPSLGWNGDNALYIAHARNLVEGVAYNATGFIQNPGDMMSPQAYPPGLPVLLAPVYAIFGFDIAALQQWMLVLFMVMLGVTTAFFRKPLAQAGVSPVLYPAAFLALYGLSPFTGSFSDRVMSDMPFVLFVYIALMALQHSYSRYDHQTTYRRWAVAAGLCIYLTIATRVIGVVLIPTLITLELLRYRRITGVSLLAVAVTLLLLAGQHTLLAFNEITLSGSNAGYVRMMGGSLIDRFADLPGDILSSAAYYGLHLPKLWYHGPAHYPVLLFVLATLVIAAYGFFRRVRTGFGVAEVFSVIYALALLPWESNYPRYMLPLVPLYFFYLLIGLAAITRALARLGVLRYAPLGIVGIIATGLYGAAYARSTAIFLPPPAAAPNSPAASAIYQFIRHNTAHDAVFVFRKPRMLALYSHRRVSTFVHDPNVAPRSDAQMLRYFEHIGVDYVLDGPPDNQHRLRRLASRYPDRFEPVFGNRWFQLYRFICVDNNRDRAEHE